MIKFFRRIRQNLISENKLTRYLVYAIGEIILVVIGILIALNINNNNEKRQREEKLKAIYIEVQRELANNIKTVTNDIEYYKDQDSLIYLVLNDKVTREDYIKDHRFKLLIANYSPPTLLNKGYLGLTENVDILPTSFNPALEKLNQVYEKDLYTVNSIQEAFKEFMLSYIEQLSNTKSWYVDYLYKGNLNDDILNYLVNDPFYKNKVFDYKIYFRNLALEKFKSNSIIAYKALYEFTGKKDDLDQEIYFQTKEALAKYIGEFKITTNNPNFKEEDGRAKLSFKIKDNQLIVVWFDDNEFEIFPHLKDVFIFNDGSSVQIAFKLNDKGEVIGLQLLSGSTYTDWVKVK